MECPKEFENLLKSTDEKLIGMGNPSAKIMIVGKESAIPVGKDDAGDLQYCKEILNNKIMWESNLRSDISQDSIIPCQFDDIGNILNFREETYNPLYPYKGQQCCVRRKRVYKGKNIIASPKGTSLTWYNYQKLCDCIRGRSSVSTDMINFHRYFFTTELSVVAGKTSKEVDKRARKKSIDDRKIYFANDFFKHFPIIILAAGNYPDMFGISHETFWGPVDNINRKCSNGIYNIVYSYGVFNRMFIRTYQLSMVPNDLIKRIADICIDFSNKFGIKI